MERQAAMLTVPQVNFSVEGARLREISDRFIAWWHGQARLQGEKAQETVYRLGNTGYDDGPGVVLAETKRIDAKKDATHTGSVNHTSYFYYDDIGAIRPYQGLGIDSRQWGLLNNYSTGNKIRIDYGHADYTVSVADFNAVVVSTNAFFRNRLQMLGMGKYRLQGLIDDGYFASFDIELRSVIGRIISGVDDKPARQKDKPARQKEREPGNVPRRPSRTRNPEPAPAAAAAALAGGLGLLFLL
jgi:hypothetical protein